MKAKDILKAIIKDNGDCAQMMGVAEYDEYFETEQRHLKEMFGQFAYVDKGVFPVGEYLYYYLPFDDFPDFSCVSELMGEQTCSVISGRQLIYIYSLN